MEAHDLFPDEMHVGGPELAVEGVVVRAVAERGDIVGERVDPDVNHVLGVERHRDAPRETRARDAQVLQPLVDELDHLVLAAFGLDEIGPVPIQLEQAVGIVGEAEEIGLLADHLDLAAAVRASAVFQLRLSPEGLAGRAVPALVLALIDVAAVVKLLKYFLHGLHVVIVRRADKLVVGDVEQFPQVLELLRDPVHIVLGGDARLFGVLLDFLTMLVRPGQKHHVVPLHSLVARNGVARQRAVAVPNVRLARRVIDGRCDVKGLFLHFFSLRENTELNEIQS